MAMRSNGRLQLGLMLPTGNPAGLREAPRWSEMREMATLAEAVGFDTLLLADHFLFRTGPGVKVAPGETRGIWEAWTLLAALAEATRRIRLCPLVLCTGFRNPALLAKMADTLDEVSNGRLILGIGAGWHEPEYLAFGYPFDHLVSRFEEALTIIHGLLRTGHLDFEGSYYSARECELRPRGPRPDGPPILIGAKGPRMLSLVARYADAYNTVWHVTPEPAVPHFENVRAACRDAGRDPATLTLTAGTAVALTGPDGKVTGLRPDALHGTPEQIAEQLRAFQSIGAEHMTVVVDPNTCVGIERFARVIEAVRRA